jgi:hypothetical protein
MQYKRRHVLYASTILFVTRTPITGYYQHENSLLHVEEVQGGGGEAVRGGEGSVDAEGAGVW